MANVMTIKGKLPLSRRPKKNLRNIIKDFMYTGEKHGEFVWTADEYKNVNVARNCIYRAIRDSGDPIKVVKDGDRIFFIRRDI